MALTSIETQRAFKARKYAEGNKQIQLWVPREADDGDPVDREAFDSRLDGITEGWEAGRLSRVFKLLLDIVKVNFSKKEP